MSRRIVRLETADRGEIELHCPEWCTDRHTAGFNTHADELVHYSEAEYVGPVASNEASMAVTRAWQEHGATWQTEPYLSVDVTLTVYAATAAQLEQAAATLRSFAAELQNLAPKLAALQAEERG
jgi:hypothetical protein